MDKNKYRIATIKDGLDVNCYIVEKGYTTIATFKCDKSDALSQEQALEDAKWYMAQKCDSETNYDPCRKFKKGDLVKKRYIFGRSCDAIGSLGIYTVVEDEDTNGGNVIVQDSVHIHYKVKAVFLQLVTPVEEVKPYSIIVQPENYHCVRIMKGTKIHSSIPFDEEECVCRTLEEAKAAAEAECDRLNAEYRKEQQ